MYNPSIPPMERSHPISGTTHSSRSIFIPASYYILFVYLLVLQKEKTSGPCLILKLTYLFHGHFFTYDSFLCYVYELDSVKNIIQRIQQCFWVHRILESYFLLYKLSHLDAWVALNNKQWIQPIFQFRGVPFFLICLR